MKLPFFTKVLAIGVMCWQAAAYAGESCNYQKSASGLSTANAASVVGQQILCACDGQFRVGDRVQLTVDGPDFNQSLVAGQLGTVLGGSVEHAGSWDPELFVKWDNWEGGHNGNGHPNCPATVTLSDTSGWYDFCGEVKLVSPRN